MCLSTIYKDKIDDNNVLMKNVMSIQQDKNLLIFTDLMERKLQVKGQLEKANLVDGYVIIHLEDQ